MLYILIAILMFGILIALHEFGHFAAAKLCGVKVNEFSIGMGPQIIHKKGKETDYSFRLFPIGGFCAMEGEEEGVSNEPRAFPNRPWWQRLIILLAGVTMNFITGVVILVCLFSTADQFYAPVIKDVMPEAEASAVLQPGDRFLEVDGHGVYLYQDIFFFLDRVQGEELDLVVERNGERVALKNVPLSLMKDDQTGQERLMLGIYTGVTEEATLGLKLRNTWFQALDYVRMVWYGLGDLISGAVGLRDLSGPVGIIGMVGDLGEQGAEIAEAAGKSAFLGAMTNILSFTAFISINLCVMNLLPIPALDGGQILLMAINGILLKVRGKKLDPKYQGAVSMISFGLLLLLMLAVTVSDILKEFGV